MWLSAAVGDVAPGGQHFVIEQIFDSPTDRRDDCHHQLAGGGGLFGVMMAATLSREGTLAFLNASETNTFDQLSRSGLVEREFGPVIGYTSPARSPDGHRLTMTLKRTASAERGDLWLIDIDRGARIRLTERAQNAVWAPDSRRVVYSSNKGGGDPDELLIRELTNVTDPIRLNIASVRSGFVRPVDWSSDGQGILYVVRDVNTGFDVWTFDLTTQSSRPVLNSPAQEFSARFSPDGRWLVYQSDESGRTEVYLQRYPVTGAKIPISTDGGESPRWGRGGTEVYWVAPDGTLMATAVRLADNPVVSAPIRLFQTRMLRAGDGPIDASDDGEHFFIQRQIASPVDRLNVVEGWTEALGR